MQVVTSGIVHPGRHHAVIVFPAVWHKTALLQMAAWTASGHPVGLHLQRLEQLLFEADQGGDLVERIRVALMSYTDMAFFGSQRWPFVASG